MSELNARKIEVVDYDPSWPSKFKEEAIKIKEALGKNVVEIHHIGSTSIPGIKAKPVIDALVEVADIEMVDKHNVDMIKLGYEALGEHGIKERRYFRKGGNNRTHHIHVFQRGNSEILRHINFRDYMIAHPKDAKAYSELKERLAKEYTYDSLSYVAGKNDFVRDIDEKARIWSNEKNRD